MTFENLLLELADGIATVTVNRPKQLNALDQKTLEELSAAFEQVGRDRAARALVITGAGEKAFVAGADIAAMSRLGPAEAREFAGLGHRVLAQLEALPIVTIAAVNGFALGGGCELTLACDLVYASERARFGQPEVNLGLVPGFGGTQRLTRRVGPMRAKELVLTGDMVDAAAARAMGLCLDVVAPEKLLEHARARARAIAARGPVAVATAKRLIQQGADLSLAEANALERQGFAGLFGGEDAKEGMRAFLEKRPAQWKGS
jgi:enoyl-CoA hydratase